MGKEFSLLLLRRLLLCSALLWASLSQAELNVAEGYVRGLPPGSTVTAAFMRLVNDSEQPVEIISSRTDSAELAEIHRHRHRDGMMSMEKVAAITIAAGEEFVFAPGGYHLMLINLYRPLREGDNVSIALERADGAIMNIVLPVRSVLNE